MFSKYFILSTAIVNRIVFLMEAHSFAFHDVLLCPFHCPFLKDGLILIRMSVEAPQRVTFALGSGYSSESAEGGSQG